MDAGALSRAYLDHLRDVRGICPRSIAATGREIDRFLAALSPAGQALDLATVTADQAQRYLQVRCRDRHPATAYTVVSAIKRFFAFLDLYGHIPANPIAALPLPQLPKGVPLPKALAFQEVEALFLAARDHSDPFFAARDFALFAAFYGLALRTAEAAALSLADVDFAQSVATIRHAKSACERQVPLPEPVSHAFQRYLPHRQHCLADPSVSSRGDLPRAFFLSHRGTPLHAHMFWNWLDAYRQRAGISRRISPHQLRHSCATHMVTLCRWPLPLVSQWLGHERQQSTLLYTHLALDDFTAALSLHPFWKGGLL